MLTDLSHYIATVETAKQRLFQFLDTEILPDNKLINSALAVDFHLGVLSSRLHVLWAMRNGSWLGVCNDSVHAKTCCYETFPFPEATPEQAKRIRALAEQIDAQRKCLQATPQSNPHRPVQRAGKATRPR